MMRERRSKGFTLLELIIVIAIIGILTSMVSFGYRGWQQNISQRQVQSDLRLATTSMDTAKNFGEGYPSSVPSSFKVGEGVAISFIWGDATRFCIQGTSTKNASINYFVDTTQGKEPKAGTCPASPIVANIPMTTPVITFSSSTLNSITLSWASVVGANSYTVRYGTSFPSTVATSCANSPCTITGLVSNTVYKVNLTATNASGSVTSTTIDAMTAPTAPSAPAATFTTTIGSGKRTYNLTATGGACSQGAREWQFSVTENGAPAEEGSLSGWQGGNTYTTSQITNGFQAPAPLTFYVTSRCTNSGGATQYGSYVQATS